MGVVINALSWLRFFSATFSPCNLAVWEEGSVREGSNVALRRRTRSLARDFVVW